MTSFFSIVSPLTLFLSFVVGGIICAICQVVIDLTSLTPARILVSLVCAGVLFGAIGFYEPLFKASGCGSSVTLLGYGGNIAKGVREAIEKDGALGILKGAFTASAAGCSAALIFGYLSALIFKGKPKRL